MTLYITFSFIYTDSTGVKEAMRYAGLVYYEEKGSSEDLTFTAVKKLDVLVEVHCMFLPSACCYLYNLF